MKTNNLYALPIDSKDVFEERTDSPAHIITKGDEGQTFDETKAIDFLCNLGTEVKAALSGRVIKVIDNIDKKWNEMIEPPLNLMTPNEQYGNFVIIAHEGQEFSWYCHLEKQSIIVQEGQNVKKGELLGVIGNTGWTIKPHLHFMITQFTSLENNSYKTLDINWEK